ncbi:MAG: hypothetical protein IKB71_05875 [Lentisphaeria bacterium]|nr:hypothetical protein [Lentisphaeria bacterium]
MDSANFLKTPVWYPALANRTFLTSFVKLRSEAVKALADGIKYDENPDSPIAQTINELRIAMNAVPGNSFVFTDCCAPTDTERFLNKNGAVFSAESAWNNLAQSFKVRENAAAGKIEHICIRPFRRMNRTREFRLFIYEGQLSAMSQYYLIRHFRRLEGVKEAYWEKAKKFIDEIIWLLPVKTLVMDIYFTSDNEILIIDLNPWGEPTEPLMLDSWDRDWNTPAGIVLMPVPIPISGDVNISF